MKREHRVKRGRASGAWHRVVSVASAIAVLAAPLLLAQQEPDRSSAILDRIRSGGALRLGFRTDARPFAYTDSTGRPAGYSISLCEKIVTTAKREFGLGSLPLEWVPLAVDSRFQALAQGKIDIICGAESETLARREDASFSTSIFPGGIGVLVRADAERLKDVLSGRQKSQPIWRATATRTLQARAFSIVEGTTSEKWLSGRMRELEVIANVTTVKAYDEGIQAVIDRRSDAFFGERALLLEASRRYAHTGSVAILERQFTYERLALAIPRGDEAFRLLVDRALSQLYMSGEIVLLYAGSFGEPDANALAFFQWNTLR
jgi:polar amino acid transport system substrate-binding protein